MNHSPAKIFKDHLTAVSAIGGASGWTGYVSLLPDTDEAPDKALAVYDAPGTLDGRDMRSGETYQHQGVNVRVRDVDYSVAYTKAEAIIAIIEAINRTTVTIGSDNYRIDSMTLTTGIIALGIAENRERRSFVINARMTLTIL